MKRFISKLLFLAIVSALPITAARAQRETSSETLIKNATVLTVTRGTLTNTDVLLKNGKIAAVGKNLNAYANARVIDATGKFVMPGIIDAHSHSMLDTINEGSLAGTSMVRTNDVLNPTDVDLYRGIAGGVTNLNLLHGSEKPDLVCNNLNASANALVIYATGKFVMPGIIDHHLHSMLDTINEGSLAVTSMVRTNDVLNPTYVDLYRGLAGGVTTLNLLHGSANPIGGLNSVVKIKYGRPAREFLFPGAMPGIKFARIGRASRRGRAG